MAQPARCSSQAKENGPGSSPGQPANSVPVKENLERIETEPLLDQKNTRSAANKHVEIVLPPGAEGEKENWLAKTASHKDGKQKDRYKDRRVDELKKRTSGSGYSETGSTEQTYSETGKVFCLGAYI